MWLRNSFCHVFGSERAISVLARLCHTAVLSASGTCSKSFSHIIVCEAGSCFFMWVSGSNGLTSLNKQPDLARKV